MVLILSQFASCRLAVWKAYAAADDANRRRMRSSRNWTVA